MAIKETTPNFSFELPNPENIMAEDCTRLRNAILAIDSALQKLKGEALPTEGGTLTGPVLMRDSDAGPFIPGQAPTEQIMSLLTDYLRVNSELENGDDANVFQANRILQEPNGDLFRVYYMITNKQGGSQLFNILRQGFDINFKKFFRSDFITDGSSPYDLAQVGYIDANHLRKVTQDIDILIKPSTGSDTADLGYGKRGFSQDLPFKSFRGAASWVAANLIGVGNAVIKFVFLEDVTEVLTANYQPPYIHAYLCRLTSLSSADRKTLKFTGNFYINFVSGGWNITTLDIETDNQIVASGSGSNRPFLSIGNNVKIVGHSSDTSRTLLSAEYDAIIQLNGSNMELVSNGQGFLSAFNGSTIKLNNQLKISGPLADTTPVVYLNWGGVFTMPNTCNITNDNPAGMRYRLLNASRLITGGRSETIIPGSAAGTKDTHSVYA